MMERGPVPSWALCIAPGTVGLARCVHTRIISFGGRASSRQWPLHHFEYPLRPNLRLSRQTHLSRLTVSFFRAFVKVIL